MQQFRLLGEGGYSFSSGGPLPYSMVEICTLVLLSTQVSCLSSRAEIGSSCFFWNTFNFDHMLLWKYFSVINRIS